MAKTSSNKTNDKNQLNRMLFYIPKHITDIIDHESIYLTTEQTRHYSSFGIKKQKINFINQLINTIKTI